MTTLLRDRHGRLPTAGIAAALTVLVLAILTIPLVTRRAPPVSQPIAFNHRKHTRDLKLGCDFCHKYYNTSAHSGLPDAQTCRMCHAAPLGKSAEAAKLTEMLNKGEPLRFNKLFRLPDYVFYTHRRHVSIAKLECTNCHDGIADTETPPERPLIRIKMKFCLDCHEKRQVTTDCTACHR